MHLPIRSEILNAFEAFYDGNYFILGKNVENFETEFATFCKSKYCVGVSNGLDALHICLKVLNIGKGDEVIVPSNTFIATVLAISYVGATPIFVEPSKSTFNIDPTKIEEKISKRTKAIVPVHLYGQACQMVEILEIAKKHKLFVIEDNAQAQGATCNGQITGSWGDINGTSFYPGKNLGALGDAGAITTNNENYEKIAKMFRNYGSEVKYHNEVVGFNHRLDELHATLLSIKLKKLNEWNVERQRVASWYFERLNSLDQVNLPFISPNSTHVFHLFVILSKCRNELMDYLKRQGIGTLIHYPIPPHLQKAYAHLGFDIGDFPISEEIANTCLSLPIYPGIKEVEVDYIAEKIKLFYA
jgi:dTDP-4-amino-4,6-dideoxygalactose transaminase